MDKLLREIRKCAVCDEYLPHGVNPVLSACAKSKLIIIGQAPGRLVHESGIPWDDKSGDNLRSWLGIDKKQFYNADIIALVPMGFCYPGTGKTGDMAPRPECAPLWHNRLFEKMPNVNLVLLLGLYSQKYYLGNKTKETLTETVQNYKNYLPSYFPLPHPSPRNNIWQVKNKWFEESVLPELQNIVNSIISEN